jgi:hypothetical protein
MERALAATRKRYAHRLANEQGTYIHNGGRDAVQNDPGIDSAVTRVSHCQNSTNRNIAEL